MAWGPYPVCAHPLSSEVTWRSGLRSPPASLSADRPVTCFVPTLHKTQREPESCRTK